MGYPLILSLSKGMSGRQPGLALPTHPALPVCPLATSPFPTSPCACYPQPMDSQKSAQQPLRHRRGAPLRRQNDRLHTLTLPQNLICFPYFIKNGSHLALQLYITFETNPLLRHNATPPLRAISCLTTIFTTPQNRLMSSSQPSARPPACPYVPMSICPLPPPSPALSQMERRT